MTHPIAAVAKKGSEKIRIVIDMSVTLLNECMVAQRFILPQVEDVAQRCYEGCFMMTCDLQDGFYGVEVRGEDRKYLGLNPRTCVLLNEQKRDLGTLPRYYRPFPSPWGVYGA